MNDVAELKEYVGVHARSQRIPGIQSILARIHSDTSWVSEWSNVGSSLAEQGKFLEAGRHFAMARFPYVDGALRAEAHTRCISAIDHWRAGKPIERLTVPMPDGTVSCWTTSPFHGERRPLLIIRAASSPSRSSGPPSSACSTASASLPSSPKCPAGENTLPYTRDSWRMFPAIMDAVADRADTSQTSLVALSFSGHMALRCAIEDQRVRSLITVGAPVPEFFLNPAWHAQLPRITVDTLAHMTRTDLRSMKEWALTTSELSTIDIPVAYTASLRDTIIPAEDPALLRNTIDNLTLVEINDVHGLPQHTTEVQLWTASTLLKTRNAHNLPARLIAALHQIQRLRRTLFSR